MSVFGFGILPIDILALFVGLIGSFRRSYFSSPNHVALVVQDFSLVIEFSTDQIRRIPINNFANWRSIISQNLTVLTHLQTLESSNIWKVLILSLNTLFWLLLAFFCVFFFGLVFILIHVLILIHILIIGLVRYHTDATNHIPIFI